MIWLDELSRELRSVGIHGRLSRRIVAELDDHLRCEPGAESRLGTPKELAARFADELGTIGARRASAVAFAALALAGALFVAVFLANSFAGPAPDVFAGEVPGAAFVLQPVILFAPQLAFVAGVLGVWRAFRLRRTVVLPAAEVRVLNKRTGVALAAGAAPFVAVGLYALQFRGELAGWWAATAFGVSGIALCGLTLAAVPLLRALRLRPGAAGEAGDLGDDLPLLASISPWRLAAVVAAGLGLAVAAAASVQGDTFNGLLGGVAEAAAILVGFALLGRPLGLRGRSRA